MAKSFDQLLITDTQILNSYAQDSVLQAVPNMVVRARDVEDVIETVKYATQNKIPLTVCGAQTSMTGSSVAQSGILLDTRLLNKCVDIQKGAKQSFIIVESGMVLADLKNVAHDHQLYYPPDPTSFNECLVGGSIATNATGEDSYKYGPTRFYVEALQVVTMAGKLKWLKRQKPPPQNVKNFAGYVLNQGDVDLLIGSEGTLAITVQAKLRLLNHEKLPTIIAILPFKNFKQAIAAVSYISTNFPELVALEFLGDGACQIFSTKMGFKDVASVQSVYLYLKLQSANNEHEPQTEDFAPRFENLYTILLYPHGVQDILIASTSGEHEKIHSARHAIPMQVAEKHRELKKNGGGKVGTDWWVPLPFLTPMMSQVYQEAQSLQIPFLVFGHIGNGHPHFNFLARNSLELQFARNFVLRQCQQAVKFGGGVAGEHGLGKIKKDLLTIQRTPSEICNMQKIKSQWDSTQLLGQGNIF